TSAFHATSHGGGRPSKRRSGRIRFRAGAWSGASTSTATGKAIYWVTEASTGRSLFTRSSRIGIGRIDSAEAISLTDSSGRTSPSRVCLTTKCVLATGTGLAKRYLREPQTASPHND